MRKKLIIMAAGILILVAAVIAVMKYNEYQASLEPEESSTSIVLKNLFENEKSNIASVNLMTQSDSITLLPGEINPTNNELTWYLEDHPHWELKHTYTSLISMATIFQVYKEIETDASGDRLADFGLAVPVATLTVTLKDGTVQKVMIGNLSSDQEYAFCMMEGDATIYACNATYYSYASFTKDSIRLATLTELNTKGQLYSMFVQKKGERPIEIHYKDGIEEELSSAETQIVSKYAFIQRYANSHVEVVQNVDSEYFSKLTSPEILETIEVSCTDFDQYGLGDEPEYRETIVTRKVDEKDSTTYQYQTTDYLFGYTYEKSGTKCIYFREAGSDLVLGVKAECMNTRKFEPFYYVNKLVYLKSISEIQEGTISTGDMTHSFSIKRSQASQEDSAAEALAVYRLDGELVESDAFLAVYRALISIAPDYEILNETPEYDETDRLEFTLTYTDGTEETISYYRLSEFYYVTKINDDIWFACGDSYIEQVIEKLEACVQAVQRTAE